MLQYKQSKCVWVCVYGDWYALMMWGERPLKAWKLYAALPGAVTIIQKVSGAGKTQGTAVADVRERYVCVSYQ